MSIKKISFILPALLTAVFISSCASAKVQLDSSARYKKEILRYTQNLFGNEHHDSSWWNASLEAEAMATSSKKWQNLGLEQSDKGQAFAGTYIRDSRRLFPVALVKEDSANYYIITGKSKEKIPFSFEGVMLSYSGKELSNELQIVKVSKFDKGKVSYTLQSDYPAGLQVLVAGREYAVVDLCTSPSTVYLNKGFADEGDLSQEEKDFVHSAIIALHDACQSFTETGKKNNTTTSLQR